jgi:hypothetical protein
MYHTGGFGEVYCSDACYGEAGSRMFDETGRRGLCFFCKGQVIHDGLGACVYLPQRRKSILKRKPAIMICRACIPQGKELFVSGANHCIYCGRALTEGA